MKTVPFLVVFSAVLFWMAQVTVAQSLARRPLVNGDFNDSPVGQHPSGWVKAYPTGTGVVATDPATTFQPRKKSRICQLA